MLLLVIYLSVVNALCFICLLSGHTASTCQTMYSCKLCNEKHNTLLHEDQDSKMSKVSGKEQKGTVEQLKTSENMTDVTQKFPGTTCAVATVLLGTAVVRVRDIDGRL